MLVITRCVYSGGGVRGAFYPGAGAVLEETGILEQVEHFAGSSAGAFTAALQAVGMTPKEFQRDLMQTQFSDLMGETIPNSWVTKDGKPMYNYLRKTINDVVLAFLNRQNPPLKVSHGCWVLFQALATTEHSPTFSDLQTLINAWPKQFKQLTITATEENGGALKIFNCQDTPNVEIALACRASGSIPVLLEPVEIEGVKYIDGGVHDNVPTECFDKNEKTDSYENLFPEKTLVFAFLDGDQNKQRSNKQRLMEYFFGGSSIFKALHGTRKDEFDNQNLYESLFEQVQTELSRRFESNTDNLDIETLIDQAIDTVADDYNWSWVKYAFAIIVSAIVAVWTFIRIFFKVPANTAPSRVDDSIADQSNATIYLNEIQMKLKDALPKIKEHQTDTKKHAETVCNHAKQTISPKAHLSGPNKPPVLWDSNAIIFHSYNLIPKLFSSFNSNYRTADKIEEGFQKIRSHYPLRTVALGVGNISPIDFDTATKHARFMSARGYLDTMTTILNLNLYKKDFEALKFYSDIITYFNDVYNEVLITSGKDLAKDEFACQLADPTLSLLSRYYLIKDKTKFYPNSDEAFALTLAVEFRKEELTKEDLLAEVDARCKIIVEKKPSSFAINLNLLFNKPAAQCDALDNQTTVLDAAFTV